MKMTMEQFQAKIQKWMRLAPKKIRHYLLKGGMLVVAHSQKTYLTGPRPEKLGVITGRLRRSIHTRIAEEGGHKLRLEIGTRVSYARRHEEGIGRMPERPFLRPAIRDKQSKVVKMVLEGMMEAYKSG
jgi:HK97 gp10 family phage protein